MLKKEFSIPVELLYKRLEQAEFPYAIVKHKSWEIEVSKKPVAAVENLSFLAARLLPSKNLLLTSEVAGKFVTKKNKVVGAEVSPWVFQRVQKRLVDTENLIKFADLRLESLKNIGFYEAAKGPIVWFSYEQVPVTEKRNTFHTHTTKGKQQHHIAPREEDIVLVWKSLQPNEETLLFVFPQDEMDESILEAYEGAHMAEKELMKKAVEISLQKRLEKDIPFYLIKIKKTKDEKLEIHVPSKVVLHVDAK